MHEKDPKKASSYEQGFLFDPAQSNAKAHALLEDVKSPSKELARYLSLLDSTEATVDKLRCTFEFLSLCLSEDYARHTQEFWYVKQICLELFKEPLEPSFRYPLWQEFIELLNQARFAKDMLTETSTYSLEQFDLALKGLTSEFNAAESLTESTWHILDKVGFDGSESSLQEFVRALSQEISDTQAKLEIFNNLAHRYRDLKEEIIATSMRPKDKRNLFDKLKALRALLFPKRKELINRVSTLYLEEVEQFIQSALDSKSRRPIFAIKEELKALQKIAKTLTLNPESFRKTRLKLSELWDQLRKMESEKKAYFAQKREKLQAHAMALDEKITLIESACQNKSNEEIDKRVQEGIRHIRSADIMRDDKKRFEDRLKALKAPFLEKEAEERKAFEEKKFQQQQARSKAIESLENRLACTLENEELISLEQMKKELSQLDLTPKERLHFEGLFERADSHLRKLKEKRLDGDTKAQLAYFKERAFELKSKLDKLRKEKAVQSLDFEKALFLEEAMSGYKEELKVVDEKLKSLES